VTKSKRKANKSTTSRNAPEHMFRREATRLHEIDKLILRYTRLTLDAVAEQGRIYERVKAALIKRHGHGFWLRWLQANKLDKSRAERCMQVAAFAASRPAEFLKLRNLNLSMSVVLELINRQTTQATVDEMIRQAQAGTRITGKEVRAAQTPSTPSVKYPPPSPPERSIAPAVPASQLSRTVSSREFDPVLQQAVELIAMACGVDLEAALPKVAKIVRAVREQQIDASVSLARNLEQFSKAFGDELARDLPHSVPTHDGGIVQVDDDAADDDGLAPRHTRH
jgi:hypothetical protein